MDPAWYMYRRLSAVKRNKRKKKTGFGFFEEQEIYCQKVYSPQVIFVQLFPAFPLMKG